MAFNRLYICMTMDVERIANCSPTGGPRDWGFAEQSVRAYCRILAEAGCKATLFIVPDTAEFQPDLYRGLRDEVGAELGLHIHPQCWGDRYLEAESHDYLGGYTGDEQRDLLTLANTQWSSAIGVEPKTFRGGNFSANDETFGVLTDLGFTHGSLSQPGRTVARYRAVWSDAIWDVHRPHPAFRQAEGHLDFVEVPLTSDRTTTDHWTGVGDVRIESSSCKQILKAARQEVERQMAEEVAIKHVCILTHNFVDYGRGDQKERNDADVLREILDGMRALGEELGLETIGATTGDVRAAYLETEGG